MPAPGRRILRRKATEELVGLKRTAIDEAEKRGEFPRRVKLTSAPKRPPIGWFEDELFAWCAARGAERNAGEADPRPSNMADRR
jgi:predicted DNA-binding transcriptional regulator AlpA